MTKIVLATSHPPKDQIKKVNQKPSKEQIKKAFDACIEHEGIGLSAVQIGINESWFVLLNGSVKEGLPINLYCNPEYKFVKTSTEENNEEFYGDNEFDLQTEGCLSVPGFPIKVKRAKSIIAEWSEWNEQTNEEVKHSSLLQNFEARVFQHETDHCNGVTILDRGFLSREERRKITKSLKKK